MHNNANLVHTMSLNILLADDCSSARRILNRKLRLFLKLDTQVIDEVATGEEALEMMRGTNTDNNGENKTYDIAILDEIYELTGGLLTGTNITEEYRAFEKAHPERGRCLIIGCTGFQDDTGHDLMATEAGQDCVWGKPLRGNLQHALTVAYNHNL